MQVTCSNEVEVQRNFIEKKWINERHSQINMHLNQQKWSYSVRSFSPIIKFNVIWAKSIQMRLYWWCELCVWCVCVKGLKIMFKNDYIQWHYICSALWGQRHAWILRLLDNVVTSILRSFAKSQWWYWGFTKVWISS